MANCCAPPFFRFVHFFMEGTGSLCCSEAGNIWFVFGAELTGFLAFWTGQTVPCCPSVIFDYSVPKIPTSGSKRVAGLAPFCVYHAQDLGFGGFCQQWCNLWYKEFLTPCTCSPLPSPRQWSFRVCHKEIFASVFTCLCFCFYLSFCLVLLLVCFQQLCFQLSLAVLLLILVGWKL